MSSQLAETGLKLIQQGLTPHTRRTRAKPTHHSEDKPTSHPNQRGNAMTARHGTLRCWWRSRPSDHHHYLPGPPPRHSPLTREPQRRTTQMIATQVAVLAIDNHLTCTNTPGPFSVDMLIIVHNSITSSCHDHVPLLVFLSTFFGPNVVRLCCIMQV
jgi:hypothetical protein